jgi:hypothetical protein
MARHAAFTGTAPQDDLSKRIADTARKIKTLRRAIAQQNAEALRIRSEDSRRVCRAAVSVHAALVGRIVRTGEELAAANRKD